MVYSTVIQKLLNPRTGGHQRRTQAAHSTSKKMGWPGGAYGVGVAAHTELLAEVTAKMRERYYQGRHLTTCLTHFLLLKLCLGEILG